MNTRCPIPFQRSLRGDEVFQTTSTDELLASVNDTIETSFRDGYSDNFISFLMILVLSKGERLGTFSLNEFESISILRAVSPGGGIGRGAKAVFRHYNVREVNYRVIISKREVVCVIGDRHFTENVFNGRRGVRVVTMFKKIHGGTL